MSESRYWTAIILAIATFVGVIVCLMTAMEMGFGESMIIGFCAGTVVGELVFWDTLPMRIAKFFFIISIIPLRFAFGILCSGIVGFIIGLMLMSPCFSAFAFCVAAAITIEGLLSLVMFPIHIFTMRGEIY